MENSYPRDAIVRCTLSRADVQSGVKWNVNEEKCAQKWWSEPRWRSAHEAVVDGINISKAW